MPLKIAAKIRKISPVKEKNIIGMVDQIRFLDEQGNLPFEITLVVGELKSETYLVEKGNIDCASFDPESVEGKKAMFENGYLYFLDH
jgi:hypothetical protein